MCIAIETNESRLRVTKQLVNAAWPQGLDITRADVVSDVIHMNDEDKHEVLKRTQEPVTKQTLLDASYRHIQRDSSRFIWRACIQGRCLVILGR